MIPTAARGTSSLIVRLSGESWMFDCGEGTQTKMQRASIHLPDISKVFITHLHGDHIFGLAGFLCGMGGARQARQKAIHKTGAGPQKQSCMEIYGPVGLRAYLRLSAQTSYARFADYVVHEIEDIPMVHPWSGEKFQKSHLATCDASAHFAKGGELLGGRQIVPDEDGYWTLCEREDGMVVRAAPISHTIPTLGYAIMEPPSVGMIYADKLIPFMEQLDVPSDSQPAPINSEDHKNNKGRKFGGVMKQMKRAPHDSTIDLPDGTSLNVKDFRAPDTPGEDGFVGGWWLVVGASCVMFLKVCSVSI